MYVHSGGSGCRPPQAQTCSWYIKKGAHTESMCKTAFLIVGGLHSEDEPTNPHSFCSKYIAYPILLLHHHHRRPACGLSGVAPGIGCDTVSGGASGQGDFTVSWAAPDISGREDETGCSRRVPQSPHVPSAEQSREPTRVPNYARMSL
jgi:hypothetical protein